MFKLTDKEREDIKKKHDEAVKKHNEQKDNLKKGLQKPKVEKKKE